MRRINKNIVKCIILAVLSFALMVSLLVVDIGEGAEGTKIGLFTINSYIYNSFSFMNSTSIKIFDVISDISLYYSLMLVVFIIGIAIYQWMKRKSIKKIDKELFAFGIIFGFLALIWIIFDRLFIINYRPDIKESSFPSTHIMLVTFILISSLPILFKFFRNLKNEKTKSLRLIFIILHITIIAVTFLGRIFTKEHWITDALGGLLISMTFNYLFIYIYGKANIKLEESNN